MKIVQNDGAFLELFSASFEELETIRQNFSYRDLSNQYKYTAAKNNKFMWKKQPYEWAKYVNDLKASIYQNLLIEKNGNFFVYSGLKEKLFDVLKFYSIKFEYTNNLYYPGFSPIPYLLHYTPYCLHPYQETAIEMLLSNPHSSIELPTGSGKQFVIQNLIKKSGLSTLIVVPFKSIAYQFINGMKEAFGEKYIGLYGDNKKEFKKKIVIGIADSISSLKESSEAYKFLNKKECIIIDESHLVGAPTVASISTGIAKNIPYRWSVSATQLRIDGKNLLLEGIIGKIIYKQTFRELVECGFLSDLHFIIYNVLSSSNFVSENPSNMMRNHHLYNNSIIQIAAKIANIKYSENESTLILIDEIKQEEILKNYLTVPYEFAQSDSNVSEKIENFNNKKTLVLIGTKAITTGANTRPTDNIILLISGKSIIKYKQALGRGTRIYPGKKKCTVFDFNICNINLCKKHFENRLSLYKELSSHIKFHDLIK